MSESQFAFSQLGKFLGAGEKYENIKLFQQDADEFDAAVEVFRDSTIEELLPRIDFGNFDHGLFGPDFGPLMAQIRRGLVDSGAVKSVEELRLLERLSMVLLNPLKRSGDFSRSKSTNAPGQIYSRRGFDFAQKVADFIAVNKLYEPYTQDVLFGHGIKRKLDIFQSAASDFANHLALAKLYRDAIESPSVLITDIQQRWPDSDIKSALESLAGDLGNTAQNSLPPIWNAFLKYRSKTKTDRRRKKPLKLHRGKTKKPKTKTTR